MRETPPICNYEGSDYQTSFWDQGGREYEDAVEALALKRMLPTGGHLLLELGAGAGRNTSRYQGYEKIVLLDYSLSQLQQARQRLGDDERYIYVAANAYHLPFVDGLFDGATMIRTLHHLADACLALTQVRRVLQSQSVFILEYANKHNLKSILRYFLHRQSWNPFTPDPVEFIPLNFDFHPATVRAWLRSCHFSVDRQLTVSHLRIGFLKRHLPLKVLVGLDSLFQLTGGLWQLTPSVFVRCSASGESPSAAGGTFFACPACNQATLENTPPLIVCPSCGRQYPLVDGIYDFRFEG